MWYSYLCFFVLFTLFDREEVVWKGRVIDGATGQPIESVHVFYKNDQDITDTEGRFELVLKADAKVTFSHIGYEVNEFSALIAELPSVIYLFPKESELDLIEVRPLPSENEFKELILSRPYIPSALEINLKKNTSVMKSVYMYIPTEGKGAYSQFMERVIPNGSGGVNFFNSSGGGLLQVFRELKQDYKIPKKPFIETDSAKVNMIYKSKYGFLKGN